MSPSQVIVSALLSIFMFYVTTFLKQRYDNRAVNVSYWYFEQTIFDFNALRSYSAAFNNNVSLPIMMDNFAVYYPSLFTVSVKNTSDTRLKDISFTISFPNSYVCKSIVPQTGNPSQQYKCTFEQGSINPSHIKVSLLEEQETLHFTFLIDRLELLNTYHIINEIADCRVEPQCISNRVVLVPYLFHIQNKNNLMKVIKNNPFSVFIASITFISMLIILFNK